MSTRVGVVSFCKRFMKNAEAMTKLRVKWFTTVVSQGLHTRNNVLCVNECMYVLYVCMHACLYVLNNSIV